MFKGRLRAHTPILGSLEKLRLRRNYSLVKVFGKKYGTRSSLSCEQLCSRFMLPIRELSTDLNNLRSCCKQEFAEVPGHR